MSEVSSQIFLNCEVENVTASYKENSTRAYMQIVGVRLLKGTSEEFCLVICLA